MPTTPATTQAPATPKTATAHLAFLLMATNRPEHSGHQALNLPWVAYWTSTKTPAQTMSRRISLKIPPSAITVPTQRRHTDLQPPV